MIRRSLTCKLKCTINNYQANLVSLHSEEEHQFVVGLNGGSGIHWLGGRRDPGNRDTWVWSDGTPWDYSNWARGQPADFAGKEDCAHIWDVNQKNTVYGLWNDAPCSSVTTFVCKKGPKRFTGYMSVTNRLDSSPAWPLTCILTLDQTLCSKAREEFKAIPNQGVAQYTDSDKGCKVRNIRCFPSTKKGTIIRRPRTRPCSLTKLTSNVFTVQTAGGNGDSCIIKPVLNPTPAANGQQ